MRISVVIPTHQRPEGLKDLLRSLADQDFAREAFEIHVVSNLRDDPSEDIVNRFAGIFEKIFWHYVGEKGVNRARNLGLKHARGEIVAMFDDDCVVPHRYYLTEIWNAHLEHPRAIAIGGGYFAAADATPVDLAYIQISDIWLKRRSEDGGKCVNLVGGNVSYKRAPLLEHGFEYKSDIVFGGAETELHLRMFRAGFELVYLDHLRVEHRARLSGLQLLRKGYKQGMASHQRWSIGLHVPTRVPANTVIAPLSFRARFWKESFDRVFVLGSDHRRGRTSLRSSRWGLRLLTRSIFSHLKRTIYLWRAGRLKRPDLVSLPLQRFYVMPVSDQCRYTCSYCETLGCKKTGVESIDDQLKKAKTYGFSEILLPCNATFMPGLQTVVEKIRNADFHPTLLINGDVNAPVDLEQVKRHPFKTGFHLLLGPASEYQNELIRFFERRYRGYTATYFHHGRKRGLRILKDLPIALANRLHFMFPTNGSAHKSKPSCTEIHRFLARAREQVRNKYLLHLRGAAGYWPIQRAAEYNADVYPLIEASWSSGIKSSSVEYSVIIPTYNSATHLVKVLRALREQTLSASRFEVLIMDDGSRDGTLDVLKREPAFPFHLRYYYWPRNPQRVHSEFRAGTIRNLGVSQARGEILCFLDSDILVPPDYLTDLERRFEQYDVIQARRDLLTKAASTRALHYERFAVQEIYPDDPYWETFKAIDSWGQTPQFWKYTCTYALSMRKDLFLKAGWFSPEFYSYGFEDVDLGYRLYKLGARFHLSQNTVYHLFPERAEHNYHFNPQKRAVALTISSRIFFQNRLDPEIFNEFYPGYYEPLATKLLKPYHFARYQYEKRILGLHGPPLLEVAHAE